MTRFIVCVYLSVLIIYPSGGGALAGGCTNPGHWCRVEVSIRDKNLIKGHYGGHLKGHLVLMNNSRSRNQNLKN